MNRHVGRRALSLLAGASLFGTIGTPLVAKATEVSKGSLLFAQIAPVVAKRVNPAGPSRVTVGGATVEGEYAIAGWSVFDSGGQTLLKRTSRGHWSILTSGGGSIDGTSEAATAGWLIGECHVPPEIARRLAHDIDRH